MSEETKCMNVLIGWGGQDANFYFNGKPFPEVYELKWEMSPTDLKPISGEFNVTVFNTTQILDVFETNGTIKVEFLNEYEQSGSLTIYGVEITKYHGGISVDDVIMEDRYEFIASMIVRK